MTIATNPNPTTAPPDDEADTKANGSAVTTTKVTTANSADLTSPSNSSSDPEPIPHTGGNCEQNSDQRFQDDSPTLKQVWYRNLFTRVKV